MATEAVVHMRVRAALALSPLEGRDRLTAGVAVQCGVGEIEAERDSAEDAHRVVWVQGGARLEAETLKWDRTTDCCLLEVPLSAVWRVPPQLTDDTAMLVGDMAAGVHVAKIVTARHLKTVAIVASAAATCLAHTVVWCLQQAADVGESGLVLHIVLLGEISDAVATSWASLTSVTVHQGSTGGDALLLDGCIDLCGIDASLDFATRQLEPLGTLALIAADRLASGPTRIDMNCVVVNELSIVNVGDFRGELSDAVEVIVTHSEALAPLVSLLNETGSILRALES